MPRVKANEIELDYDAFGSGPEPLVLAHGYTQSRIHWRGLVEALPLDRLRIYAFDLPGHGRSDAPASGYSMSEVADDLAVATERLGLESFHFAGHSMGANVGMALAARHPPRLRRLVLISAAPAEGIRSVDPDGQILAAAKQYCPDTESYWSWIEGWTGRPIGSELLNFFKREYEGCGELEKAYVGLTENLLPLLSKIKTPSLVVTGDRDGLLDANLRNASRIPCCALHVFYRAGHMLEMEVPDELARLLMDFIENGVPQTAGATTAV